MTDLDELERLAKDAGGLPEVEFMPIDGISGYLAGSDGNIWSFSNWRGYGPRPLKGKLTEDGYIKVEMKNGDSVKKGMVHRIICIAFHGSQKNRQHQVRHLNGIKVDNKPGNLAWGTAKENADDRDLHGTTACGERNGWSKLTDQERGAIKTFHSKGMPTYFMAAYLGVSQSCIDRVIRNG